MNQLGPQILILVIFIFAMYFLLIRPQKKKEKQINEMRNSIQVGDEIVTIGGICGKVVKTKDDSIVIQVGADKVKFEMKRWSVSTVEKKSSRPEKPSLEETETSKPSPKRLRKSERAKDEAEEKPEAAAQKDDIKEDAPKVVEAPSAQAETDDSENTDAEEK